MNFSNSRAFNAQDFISSEADFAKLDAPRPLGLSGHLRVRNEALTLRACLDSCLPFLDELIITYNDSTDNTEDILHEYAARYAQKIRLYWYPLEWGPCRGKKQLRPLGHLAQFCNFGYTKINYAFYMKIDGDQVYFTKKMLFIKQMLYKYAKLTQEKPIPHSVPLSSPQDSPQAFYEKSIAKMLNIKKKYSFVLGGLEACYNDGELYVYTLENLDEKPLFNGFFGDTFIVNPSSAQRYHMQGDYYEIFPHTNTTCVTLGLVWVHLGYVKTMSHIPQSTVVALRNAAEFTWQTLYECINTRPTKDIKTHNIYKNIIRQYWERDVKTYLTKEFYDKYFPHILNSLEQKSF